MTLTEHFGRGKPQNISIVSTGPGAKHTPLCCLNFTWYDLKRGRARYKQAGRGGIGTVFADKRIKALVARYNTVGVASNHPADEAGLKEVGKLHTQEILELDPKQNEMAKIGTTHLVTIMNDYDLLPRTTSATASIARLPTSGRTSIAGSLTRDSTDAGSDARWLARTESHVYPS